MRIDSTSSLLATGAADGCAKVWDIAGGFCTHVFRNHGGIVSALAWNTPPVELDSQTARDGQRRFELFTGDIDGKIRLWDLRGETRGAQGKRSQGPLAVLDAHFSVVRGLAISDDGTKLVSASRDRMLSFWQRRKTVPKASSSKKDINGTSASVSWNLCDSVTAGESLESAGFLRRGSTLLKRKQDLEKAEQDLVWTGGAEGEIRIWSFTSQVVVAVQPGGRWATDQARAQQPHGRRRSEERESSEDLDKGDEDETRAITEVHYAAQIDTLVSVHADQTFSFRCAPVPVLAEDSERRPRRRALSRLRQLVGFNDQIIDLALLSPGDVQDSHLAVATNSTSVRIYHLGAAEHDVQMLPSDSRPADGHAGLILCLDKCQGAKWLVTGSKDATARIWAQIIPTASCLDEGEVEGKGIVTPLWRCVAVAKGHTESVGAIAFARRNDPQGHPPFMVTGSQDRTAKVWDLSTMAEHIKSLQSNPDADPLFLSSLTTLKIHDKDINALDVAPNNALLLSGSQDRTAKLFSISYTPPSKANASRASASLKQLTTCRAHKRGVWSVAFSPTDAAFVTASGDRTVRLWSLATFGCVKTFEGHTNAVLRARFLPQFRGMQLLTSASDGLVKLWSVRDEICVDTLDGHEDRVWGLECRQNASEILSAGADGMIRVWQDRTELDVEEAAQQRQVDVEREQRFTNFVALRDYRNAIALALAMDQPRRLFDLFSSVDASRGRDQKFGNDEDGLFASIKIDGGQQAGSITGSHDVDDVIRTMSAKQLARLLTFVRDWNTSARTAGTAQMVLHAVLRLHSPQAIIDAFEWRPIDSGEPVSSVEAGDRKAVDRRSARRSRAQDLASIVDALIPYTERHYSRAERILTESSMLEYTLEAMDAILGPSFQDEQAQTPLKNGVTTPVPFEVAVSTDEESDAAMSEDLDE
ncbi:WD40 repeat-like protein [Acaromyces ingoldii]|uniref:WD40 repeat-like protein n=1 Tax=Acaromyces ingoldii TaxID=215250 RepID=A0A316YMM1_9BASI|nr:WD40 repeat-like protein [Acaromyces ingoldii]PWN90617.1 WD40 repeat-like protein [Acaromyces ingoldii]